MGMDYIKGVDKKRIESEIESYEVTENVDKKR